MRKGVHNLFYNYRYGGCLSTRTLFILVLSRTKLSKVSFSDILRNDYLDHFDNFGLILTLSRMTLLKVYE